jgi:epidermal growth factor receptor substrate 15
VEKENARFHSNSADIGILYNELSPTRRSLKSMQEEPKTPEETLAGQSSHNSLQSQLLSATAAAYGTEKQLLETLQERMRVQSVDILKSREELLQRETELRNLRLKRCEVEGALLRDKEEAHRLQQQIKKVDDKIELVIIEIEDVEREVRLQKDALAIAKRRLTASQAEKDRVLQDLKAAKLELEEVQKEVAGAEAQIISNSAAFERS